MSGGYSRRETFGLFKRTLELEEDLESLLAWDLSVVHEFRSGFSHWP